MSYLNFGEKDLTPNKSEEVVKSYDKGFVYTRTKRGHMERVRSLRINLKSFEQSSENRRILRKFNENLTLSTIPYPNYSWEIHKLGKDFYDTKFGKDTFSANKIKQLFTSNDNNFTNIISFSVGSPTINGYCICHISVESDHKIIHYAYPFYKLDLLNSSFGIFMMTKTIQYFKEHGFDYIYLGSVHEPESLYKLQFKGLEWFDETQQIWSQNLELLKIRVRSAI